MNIAYAQKPNFFRSGDQGPELGMAMYVAFQVAFICISYNLKADTRPSFFPKRLFRCLDGRESNGNNIAVRDEGGSYAHVTLSQLKVPKPDPSLSFTATLHPNALSSSCTAPMCPSGL
jgi:hypothetical protein